LISSNIFTCSIVSSEELQLTTVKVAISSLNQKDITITQYYYSG